MSYNAVESTVHKGLTLLEASAGTGKTYSLVRIIARHLVEDKIPLKEVLTVTFTKAATAEIKSRLHELLYEVFTQLKGDAPIENDLAVKWNGKGEAYKQEALQSLVLALASYDAVPIFTIDGFFQRLLKEYAFESRALFSAELETDEGALQDQALRDYWRSHVYRLSAEDYAQFQNHVKIDKVKKFLQDALRASKATFAPEYSQSPQEMLEREKQDFQAFAEVLRKHKEALLDFVKNPPKGLGRSDPYRKGGLEKLEAYLSDALSEQPREKGKPNFLSNLGINHLLGKEAIDERTHPLTPVFRAVQEYLDTPVPDLTTAYYGAILAYVRDQLVTIKSERNVHTYSDVAQKLATLFQQDSPSAQAMVQSIRKSYQAALIDEFQDTSPEQCQVFLSLFHHAEGYFHIIGDPKQSIYRFRGADVYAYIQASDRADYKERLDTNYRSTPEMIHAVNKVFQHAEDPFLVDGKISFYPSQWPTDPITEEPIPIDAQTPSLFIHSLDPELTTKAGKQGAMFHHLCREVQSLIGQEGVIPEEPQRSIQPSDIAVLVRSTAEGSAIYDLLTRLGIPAVTQTQTSLFDTTDAYDLYTILRAALSPNKPSHVRTALMAKALGSGALLQDESSFISAIEVFTELHQIWQSRGVIPMIHALCDQFNIHQSLLGRKQGLRSHTNILHLAEVLDRKSREEYATPEDITRWLEMAVHGTIIDADSDVLELRLDTDRPAVKILTQHSSKGLEFPIVFITPPCFAAFSRDIQPSLSYHDADNQLCIDSITTSPAYDKRVREECADKARLAYVALTRAKYLCHFYYEPPHPQKAQEHAVHLMLGSPSLEHLQQLAADSSGCIAVAQIGQTDFPTASPYDTKTISLTLEARSLQDVHLTSRTRTTSFSGLSGKYYGTHHHASPSSTQPLEDAGVWVHLQAGVNLGSALHEVLEEVDFQDLTESQDVIRQKLEKYQPFKRGFKMEGLDALISDFEQYLTGMLDTPLACDHLRLNQIPAELRLIEPEFLLTPSSYSLPALATVLRNSPPPHLPTGYLDSLVAMDPGDSHGFLTGFVDMIFEHEGRYHILDWKTNKLDGYTPEDLSHAMAAHHYFLQYHLYTLALDRFLQMRLGDRYDPSVHLGNVYYVFLRGVTPGTPGSGVFMDSLTPDRLSALRETYIPPSV